MSIHSLLEQSRRNLAWRTCPTATTPPRPRHDHHHDPAAPAAVTAPAGQLLQAA